MTGKRSAHGRLFLLDMGQPSLFASSMRVLNKIWTIWHKRLGHLNNANFLSLFKLGSLEKSVTSAMFSSFAQSKCETCCLSKSHVLPFPTHHSHATAPFDIIHTNVWGIAPQLSRLGYKYYVT